MVALPLIRALAHPYSMSSAPFFRVPSVVGGLSGEKPRQRQSQDLPCAIRS